MTWRSRFSNSPFTPAPACSSPTSSTRTLTSRSGGGTSPCAMRWAKPSTTAVFPTPASPIRIGLFCRRRISTSITWRISASRPMIGSISPRARLLGQVDREALQRLLLPHQRRRRSVHRPPLRPETGEASGEPRQDGGKILAQHLGLHPLELPADRGERVAQRRRLQRPQHEMPGAHLRLAEHQRGEHPAALDRLIDLRCEIGDRTRPARQPVQCRRHVTRQPRRVEFEMPHDAVQVGILRGEDLMHPVHQLDIRVAAQLAEHGRAFDRAVRHGMELAEQCGATDLGHGTVSATVLPGSFASMVRAWLSALASR